MIASPLLLRSSQHVSSVQLDWFAIAHSTAELSRRIFAVWVSETSWARRAISCCFCRLPGNWSLHFLLNSFGVLNNHLSVRAPSSQSLSLFYLVMFAGLFLLFQFVRHESLTACAWLQSFCLTSRVFIRHPANSTFLLMGTDMQTHGCFFLFQG